MLFQSANPKPQFGLGTRRMNFRTLQASHGINAAQDCVTLMVYFLELLGQRPRLPRLLVRKGADHEHELVLQRGRREAPASFGSVENVAARAQNMQLVARNDAWIFLGLGCVADLAQFQQTPCRSKSQISNG